MEWNRKIKYKKVDDYILGNYKWKESSFGNISIVDFEVEELNGKMSVFYKNNKWMNEYI